MSRPPYPHRCLGGDPFVWACRCEATPKVYSAETARDGWGSGCPIALRERIAEQDRHIASLDCRFAGHVAEISGKHCPPGQPCERCEAEARVERAEAMAAAAIKRADEAEARCDALEERMTTADVPWRVPGCQCPADSKPGDRCDARWTRCNGRLQWLRALKAAGEGR